MRCEMGRGAPHGRANAYRVDIRTENSMFLIRPRWPRVAEYWFGEAVHSADVAIVRQAPSEPARGGMPFQTLHIDLTRPEPQLMDDMDAQTRYEVRRKLAPISSGNSIR